MHLTTRLMVVLAIIYGDSLISGAAPMQITGGTVKAPGDIRISTLSGFTVDYPKKDWQPLVGAGSSLVVFVHKSREATVAIERTKVDHPLAQNDITEQTATLETDVWSARRPLSTGFSHQFVDTAGGGRLIVIDFTQPGPLGAEHVRMYTLPRGTDWFRVICTSTQASFEKYKDTCHKIALSLTPAPPQ
jgi:hypothetical protein